MAEHVFFEKGRNRGNTRVLTIKGAKLLPGRTDASVKRIAIDVDMPLSGQKTTGTPDWLSDAHTFVAKTGDSVHPTLKFKGFDIDLATDNATLFGDGKISAPKCNMSAFKVHATGNAEEPDIMLSFVIQAPFSGPLWQYVGQMSNDDIWARFTQSAASQEDAEDGDEQEDLELDDEEDSEDEEEEEEGGVEDDTNPDGDEE